ncbi:MAG: hypothetical protein ACRCSN_19930 [Dermatophilaceae bacterium]
MGRHRPDITTTTEDIDMDHFSPIAISLAHRRMLAEMNSARPDAQVVPHRPATVRPRRTARPRLALAGVLRRAAAVVEPRPQCHPSH